MVSVPTGDGTGKHRADHIRPYGMTAAGTGGRMVSVPAGDETGKHWANYIRPCGMAAAGTGGRTLCAPTEKGIPNRWDCTKGGRVRPLLGSTPNKGPVVAAFYKGGCVGAAMSRPPFRFSALSVGAGPRPARRIAGKPDAGKKSLAGEWYLFPRGMGQGNIGRIISAPAE